MSDKQNKQNEYDRFLPVANIGRIIKHNLPREVKLSKDAKETFQECVSEFISFITSEASDKCNTEKRKTINGDDVIFALSNLGFEHYTPVLKIYLEKYRESQKLVPNSEKNKIHENEENELEDPDQREIYIDNENNENDVNDS
jgi:nuclear transcription Y subunit beta